MCITNFFQNYKKNCTPPFPPFFFESLLLDSPYMKKTFIFVGLLRRLSSLFIQGEPGPQGPRGAPGGRGPRVSNEQ